ncbi:Period circadian protein, partial [Neofusicoccum parvum]
GTHGTTTGTHGIHDTTTGTHGTTTGTHGTHGTTTGAGYGTTGTTGSHVQHDNPHSTNAGPHESNIANKADPRFDSDLNHRGAAGTHTGTHTGTTGTTGHTTGTHDVTGTHGTHGTTSHATGTHDTTGVRPDGTKTDAHPSHGTGLVGKVLDTVDPRVKKA